MWFLSVVEGPQGFGKSHFLSCLYEKEGGIFAFYVPLFDTQNQVY